MRTAWVLQLIDVAETWLAMLILSASNVLCKIQKFALAKPIANMLACFVNDFRIGTQVLRRTSSAHGFGEILNGFPI